MVIESNNDIAASGCIWFEFHDHSSANLETPYKVHNFNLITHRIYQTSKPFITYRPFISISTFTVNIFFDKSNEFFFYRCTIWSDVSDRSFFNSNWWCLVFHLPSTVISISHWIWGPLAAIRISNSLLCPRSLI